MTCQLDKLSDCLTEQLKNSELYLLSLYVVCLGEGRALISAIQCFPIEYGGNIQVAFKVANMITSYLACYS